MGTAKLFEAIVEQLGNEVDLLIGEVALDSEDDSSRESRNIFFHEGVGITQDGCGISSKALVSEVDGFLTERKDIELEVAAGLNSVARRHLNCGTDGIQAPAFHRVIRCSERVEKNRTTDFADIIVANTISL